MKGPEVVLFVSVIFELWMGLSSARKASDKESATHKTPLRPKEERKYVIKEKGSEVDDGDSLLLRPNYLASEPENVPAGMTNVKHPGGSLTAAGGDGTLDDTSAIQAIVNHAASSINNKVFFPRGEYLISSDIAIPGPVELHGTQSGIAVITSSTPYALKIHNASPVKSVLFNNVYFDGIRVKFDGEVHGPSATSNITIKSCIFFSSGSPTPRNAKRQQLKMVDLGSSNVYRSIFLRDSNAYGVASKFTRTVGVDVRENIFGLDLSKGGWLATKVEPVWYWRDRKEKLEFLMTHYNLEADQGFFKSCCYEECDERMRLAKNIFNGSPNIGRHRDHVMYLKGFNMMEVVGNYIRGWPADLSGGIKARNGKNLLVARNYVDDTGILLYTHRKIKPCLHNGLKNVVIYGNHLVQRTNPGHRASGISYYEPHNQGRDRNITYSANVFEIFGVSDPSNYTCIWLTNGDLSQHHVLQDNSYYGAKMPVKLHARYSTPLHETKENNVGITNRYNYPLYKLNIPPY